MKILHITAGAANMYCGSCLRDNALAAQLISDGHDVVLLPVYTPTLTDEENVSKHEVLFGGISVYLQQHSALFRNTPKFLDKIWDSQIALRAASKRSIPVDPKFLGEMAVSMLLGEAGVLRKEFEKLTAWLKHEPAPDLITLPNSLLIGMAGPIKRATGKPVACTLQGEDLFLSSLHEPYRTQALDLIRSSISDVDLFIAVSAYCAEFMAEYLQIPSKKIRIVPLGINLEGYGRPGWSRGSTFRVGYFARIAPEKGLHNLCDAYRVLRKKQELGPASLEVAGYLPPEHEPYLADLEKKMRDWGLGGEFHYHGALGREKKLEFLRSLDVLSVPAEYVEQKGISILEAMASGVPVVQPRQGAYTEMIERTGGGILIAPGDARGFAAAFERIWCDLDYARELSAKATSGVREHYSVAQEAKAALKAYSYVVNRTPTVAKVHR
jgi:glycosyltransferase involved in cell wall biosynthesis